MKAQGGNVFKACKSCVVSKHGKLASLCGFRTWYNDYATTQHTQQHTYKRRPHLLQLLLGLGMIGTSLHHLRPQPSCTIVYNTIQSSARLQRRATGSSNSAESLNDSLLQGLHVWHSIAAACAALDSRSYSMEQHLTPYPT